MADISQEVEQLRNAEYGEEVRGAFISCMEKINKDNESYKEIKESVDASAEKVEQQVEEIDTKSESNFQICENGFFTPESGVGGVQKSLQPKI